MRFIILFLIGLLSFFYLAALVKQTAKIKLHSILGLGLIIFGIVLFFWGQNAAPPPLNSLLAFLMAGAGLGVIFYHLLSENYIFSEKIEKEFVSRHESGFDRFLEILPGALTWFALTSPIWLSFFFPFAVAYIIIVADIYWLFNSVKIAALIYIGYRKVETVKRIDWLKKLEQDFPDTYKNYYHLYVVPNANEGLEVIGPSFDAIGEVEYPRENIFLAVGFEERIAQKDPQRVPTVEKYLKNVKSKIGGVFTSIHPFGLPGEVIGPGTNRNWMIKNAVAEFKKLGIKPEQVIVTTLDADFVIHPQFPACSLHKYLSTPAEKRDKCSYTGAIFYYNNYWQAPAVMRLIASGTAFWQLAEMIGSDKYINYSSMSINMQSLLDIGGWIPDKVNDDSGFYWKAYFHYNGEYKVLPHFMPINGDTVLDINLPKTFINQYQQLKRWAYGVEHIPYIVKSYFKSKNTDFWDKTDKLLFVLWANLKWGTLALFISFGGLLIPFFNPTFAQSVVAHNLSVISSWILTAAFFGLAVTVIVHEKTVPPRPKEWSPLQKTWSYIQWALLPIIIVTIATLPAIDAQTSLMLGRYLEYRVTNKARA